ATLAASVQRFVRERLSAHEYPREVAFVEEMPLTTSGKIVRRVFRERAKHEAGLETSESTNFHDACRAG
ncbi:MAG TPA: hypothetical protein ENH89_04200, partial [Aurantimonas coralicida]|nr:hypothetical protein [Aurantimonas coralicida]